MGVEYLCTGTGCYHPGLRLSRGPLRDQAHVPFRNLDFRSRLLLVWTCSITWLAHPRSCFTGIWRWHRSAFRTSTTLSRLPAQRTRHRARLFWNRLGGRTSFGSDFRRLAGRYQFLALDLFYQYTDWHIGCIPWFALPA